MDYAMGEKLSSCSQNPDYAVSSLKDGVKNAGS